LHSFRFEKISFSTGIGVNERHFVWLERKERREESKLIRREQKEEQIKEEWSNQRIGRDVISDKKEGGRLSFFSSGSWIWFSGCKLVLLSSSPPEMQSEKARSDPKNTAEIAMV
jgi:hypothetical protein